MTSSSDGTGSSQISSLQDKIKQFTSSAMGSALKMKRGWLLVLAGGIAVIIFYASVNTSTKKMSVESDPEILQPRQKFWFEGYTVWPEFESKPVINNQHFQTFCAKTVDYSIDHLETILEEWSMSADRMCQSFHEKFKSIYSVEFRKAPLSFPDTFYAKVKGWLGNKPELIKELSSQTVIHMINKYTREHTIFNPLRDKRPVMPVAKNAETNYVDAIVANTSSTCDFCKFRQMTAEHTFGRIESQYSFTASNVFKIDTLHALVALKQHHPLNWNRAQFLDVMSLTVTWLNKAKNNYPESKYPSLIWDVLPHCGASQVHPHIQVMFDPTHYHGVVESWRRGAQDYFNLFNRNYYSDLVNIHSALNLTVPYGGAVAFPSLVPRKDHEVVVMSKEADVDFFHLLYFVLRAFVDDLHKFCYSMGLSYPSLGSPEGKIPAYARIITRGAVTELRNDISSLELFTATNVNIDPWKTKQLIESSVQKRK